MTPYMMADVATGATETLATLRGKKMALLLALAIQEDQIETCKAKIRTSMLSSHGFLREIKDQAINEVAEANLVSGSSG